MTKIVNNCGTELGGSTETHLTEAGTLPVRSCTAGFADSHEKSLK